MSQMFAVAKLASMTYEGEARMVLAAGNRIGRIRNKQPQAVCRNFHKCADLNYSNRPVRAVRIEAAWLLAPVRATGMTAAQSTQLQRSVTEYIDSQMAMAERPGARVNLGNLFAARGEPQQAAAQ